MDEKISPPPYEDNIEASTSTTPFPPSAPHISKEFQLDEKASANTTSSAPCINDGFEPDEEGIEKPPPSAPPLQSPAVPRSTITALLPLKEQQLRDACQEYISQHCCYGSRFIRDMILTDIQDRCVFHYKLESYGEKRESTWTYESYHGQIIDGPENGPAPQPWDMSVIRTHEFFEDYRKTAEIPHTAYVKTCDKCNGRGSVTCSSCHGSGRRSCTSCHGSGRNRDERCSSCGGSGRSRCFSCGGSGSVTCSKCSGRGKLKHYRMLIVTWKNHEINSVSETWNLPHDLILNAQGREVFEEQGAQVFPMNHAPDEAMNQSSVRLVQEHSTAFPQESIIQQRHKLRAVPLTKACWIWKKKHGEFYVYGFQNQAYFEEYPQKYCCCTCC